MKNLKLLSILIILSIFSCSKPDIEESLFKTIEYERHYLETFSIDGRLSQHIIYKSKGIVDQILYYNNDGQVSFIEDFIYEGDMVVAIQGNNGVSCIYKYDEHNRLIKRECCGSGNSNCTMTVYEYLDYESYNGSSCPLLRTDITYSNNFVESYTYQYLNKDNCSRFVIGPNIGYEVKNILDDVDYIDPWYRIFPQRDYYYVFLHQSGNYSEEVDVITHSKGYPTLVNVDITNGTNNYTQSFTFSYLKDEDF